MSPDAWAKLSPEEKKRIRREHQIQKDRRSRHEKRKEARLRQRYEDEVVCAKLRPGDWMKLRKGGGITRLQDKIVRFVAWNDDGHNSKRAARNKLITVEYYLDDGNTERVNTRLWGFRPLNAMQVIAEASR